GMTKWQVFTLDLHNGNLSTFFLSCCPRRRPRLLGSVTRTRTCSIVITLSRSHRLAPDGRFRVGNGSRNGEFDRRTGIGFAPDSQLTPNQFGAFLHPRDAVVSGPTTFTQNLRVNALSVVVDSQP